MREIKFRAWSTKHKRMFETSSGVDEDGDWYTSGDYSEVCEVYEDNEKIMQMQFIGLKDKNSKEIYEGDILRDKNQAVCVVGFGADMDNVTFGFRLEYLQTVNSYCIEPSLVEFEVIGNIYENPELLEDKI